MKKNKIQQIQCWKQSGGCASFMDIAQLIRGVTYSKKDAKNYRFPDCVGVYRANNIQNGSLTCDDLVYVPRSYVDQNQIVRENDIVLAMSSGSKNLVGKCAQSKINTDNAFGTFCGLIRPSKFIDPKFLGYFLETPGYRRLISEVAMGVNINNLRREHIESLNIPICPLLEQKRIVAKIESLFSRLDSAKDSLERVRVEIKRYRQSVLRSAFEGDYEEILLEDVLSVKSGNGLIEKERNNQGKYYVYGGNGIAGNHDEFMFKEERLVIGRVGANCGNVHITKPYCWVTDNAFVVTFKKKVNLKFMKFYIGNMNLNQYSGSSAQPVISGAKIYPIKIHIPNVEQQDKIVELIESRFEPAKVLEETVVRVLAKIEQLKQSILKKAFEGKLVEPDPNDEPVEVLLERIKKEKAKLG